MKQKPKSILYIGHHFPCYGTGTGIIIRRHLERIENKGVKIYIAVPESEVSSQNVPDSWKVIKIPKRRKWWLPHRENIPGSNRLRNWYQMIEISNVLNGIVPDCILSVLWGPCSELAAYISKKWNVPISVIVHDLEENWVDNSFQSSIIRVRKESVLKQASCIWPVSEKMKNTFSDNVKYKTNVLYPIPEGVKNTVKITHPKTDPFVLAHAGTLHAVQLPNFKEIANSLDRIGGQFLIISPDKNPQNNDVIASLTKSHKNVIISDYIEKNTSVLDFLREHASAIFVSYALIAGTHQWADTSFPSRFIEFSHLGLPVIIVAPKEAAITAWCEQNNWEAHFSNLQNGELDFFFQKLKTKQFYLSMAYKTISFSKELFNPDVIQLQFENQIVWKNN
jgi:hypothetical protein